MLKMSQVETIKDLQAQGLGPVAIAERLNISRKTVSMYIGHEKGNVENKVGNTRRNLFFSLPTSPPCSNRIRRRSSTCRKQRLPLAYTPAWNYNDTSRS